MEKGRSPDLDAFSLVNLTSLEGKGSTAVPAYKGYKGERPQSRRLTEGKGSTAVPAYKGS
eukprot:237308-Pelagomonas_calceolata.AAC.2